MSTPTHVPALPAVAITPRVLLAQLTNRLGEQLIDLQRAPDDTPVATTAADLRMLFRCAQTVAAADDAFVEATARQFCSGVVRAGRPDPCIACVEAVRTTLATIAGQAVWRE